MLNKYKYIFSALLFFLFVTATFYVSNVSYTSQVKEVFNVADLISNCKIKKISESNQKYDITVFYPETEYTNLNEKIYDKMQEFIQDFKDEVTEYESISGNKLKLEINFSPYEYENYFSYSFEIFNDFGGAHPNTTVWTVSYNIKDKQIVDINYLIGKNKNIINILSEYTFSNLKENEKIKENYLEEMLIEGTSPKKENFENFVFTKEGLKIIFQRYSVAPYALGEFSVIVPYEKLDIL